MRVCDAASVTLIAEFARRPHRLERALLASKWLLLKCSGACTSTGVRHC